MFPESPDLESEFPKSSAANTVPPSRALQLGTPIFQIRLGKMTVLRTRVVKAPVSEQRKSEAGHDDIGLPGQIPYVLVDTPARPQCRPNTLKEPCFRSCAGASDASHQLAALLCIENVGHDVTGRLW